MSRLPLRLPSRRFCRDLTTTYAGFLANALFGFATLRLLARYLDPGAFGATMLAQTFMGVIAGLGELGIGTALVRLASLATRAGETERVGELVVAALRLKLVVVLAVCGAAYGLMPWIAGAFLHRPAMTALLRYSLLGGGLLSFVGFSVPLFQIRGAFRDSAAVLVAAGAVRAGIVAELGRAGHLDQRTAVTAIILMNAADLCFSTVALRKLLRMLPWHCSGRQSMVELARYAKPLVVWLLAGTFQPRADILLLPHYFTDNRVLGAYSAATRLCLAVTMLTGSLNMVLLPRISALRTPEELLRSLRKSAFGAAAILAVLTPAALAAGPLAGMLFGPDYAPAAPVLRLLLLAAVVNLALSPLSHFWHALNRPVMLSALSVIRLASLVGIAVFTIPCWGLVGTALAVLASTILPLAGQGAVLWAVIRHRTASADLPIGEGRQCRRVPDPVFPRR